MSATGSGAGGGLRSDSERSGVSGSGGSPMEETQEKASRMPVLEMSDESEFDKSASRIPSGSSLTWRARRTDRSESPRGGDLCRRPGGPVETSSETKLGPGRRIDLCRRSESGGPVETSSETKFGGPSRYTAGPVRAH